MKYILLLVFGLSLATVVTSVSGKLQTRLTVAQRAAGLRLAMGWSELLAAPNDVPIEMSEVVLLERKGDRRLIWLDARSEAEQHVSVIPGAVPSRGFTDDRFNPEKEVVIVYDTIGFDALERAQSLNLDRRWHAVVRSLRGGTIAWAQAGRAFQDGRGPTKRLRISAALWNLAPPGYDVSW